MLSNEGTTDGKQQFACALNGLGRFAQTRVGDFEFRPEAGRHIWQGKIVETAAELAVCVNGAIKSIVDFGDPFKSIEVVGVGFAISDCGNRIAEREKESPGDADSVAKSLIAANEELLEVIRRTVPGPRGLRGLTKTEVARA